MIDLGKRKNEAYNIRPFTYLGTKRLETQDIWEIIKEKAEGKPFVDAFGGSASVSSAFMPFVSSVHYNEKNKLIPAFLTKSIDYYRNGKFDWFWNEIMSMAPTDKESYFSLRDKFNSEGCKDPLRYYLLISCCTSGLIRWNAKSGRFTQAYSGKKLSTPGYKKNLESFCKLWSDNYGKWEITSEDFKDLEVKPEAFVYLDPPYSNAYNSYLPEKWDDKPLIEWIEKLPNNIAISGMQNNDDPLCSDCELLSHFIKKGWKLHVITDKAFSKVAPSSKKGQTENVRQKKDRSRTHDVLLTNF